MFRRSFQSGDLVVYRKTKHSPHPGPRAEQIVPSRGGDDYAYCVDKYWLVKEQSDDQCVIVKTRRGKTHTLSAHDPNLRHAYFWERWFLAGRFPSIDTSKSTDKSTEGNAASAAETVR